MAELSTQLADAARILRHEPGEVDALEALDAAVTNLDEMLGLYEEVLSEREIRRPY